LSAGVPLAAFDPAPVFLTGPTASGKTPLGVALAERLGGEIISMDSMAIYRRMDIGTAKPSAAERARVPHHLVDLLDPWEEFSLADYLRAAYEVLGGIAARGRRGVFVGGTPLYLKALLRGVEGGPPPVPELRARLEREAAERGSASLHERLRQVDPASARRIHPHDLRRLVRALEVFENTGVPPSAAQVHFDRPPLPRVPVLAIDLPRPELYRRINDRVAGMIAGGLVGEVQALLRLERPLSRTARQALGYKEVIEHLEGKRTLAETSALVQRRSRQFAKRQLTWLRGIPECRLVPAHEAGDAAALAARIERWGQAGDA
jgi:tRNA dimethylallyltransferase